MIRCHLKAFHSDDIPVAGDLLLKLADSDNLGLPSERLLFKVGYFSVLITAAILLTNIEVQSWGKFLSTYLDFIDLNLQIICIYLYYIYVYVFNIQIILIL